MIWTTGLKCGIDKGYYLEAKDKDKKTLNIVPPKDRIEEIIKFYENN